MSRGPIALAAGGCLIIGTLAVLADASPAGQKMAVVFWTLSGLIILLAIISEAGGSADAGRGDVRQEVHIHAPPVQQQVQYIAVPQEAPPPQIVYVEREAPVQTGVTGEEVARIVADALARQQLAPPAQQAVLLAPPPHRPMEIEAEYRTLRTLPSGKPSADQPLRLPGPKKSIADRVAVALLSKPKGREKA